MEEAIVGHLKLAIVRMLYSQGFTKSSTHTVAVLTDLLDRYFKLLVASCADYAHHAGRPSVNAYDTLLAMEEMGTTLDDMRDYCDVEVKDTQKYTAALPKSAQELAELKGMSKYLIFLYRPLTRSQTISRLVCESAAQSRSPSNGSVHQLQISTYLMILRRQWIRTPLRQCPPPPSSILFLPSQAPL